MSKLVKRAERGPPLELQGRDLLLAAAMASLSDATKRAYLGDWRRFGRWWEGRTAEQALEDLVQLSVQEARTLVLFFREHLEDRGLAPATVKRTLLGLNTIVRKLHHARPDEVAWTLDSELPRVRSYRDTHGPSPEEWGAFLAAVQAAAPEDPKAARDLAIVLLLRDSALRRAEVCSLDLAHFESRKREVRVLGKGARHDTDRVAQPITTRTLEAIRAWLNFRGKAPGPLFVRIVRGKPQLGERLNGQSIRYVVEKWAMRAGLEIRMSPHRLRHSGITAAATRWEGGIPALARWARHKSPQTTMVYVDNVAGQEREIAELVEDDGDGDGE